MKRSPLARQRSPWVDRGQGDAILGFPCRVYERQVHDGILAAIVAEEPAGWHLSISHRTNHRPPRLVRYPTWDEMAHARYELLPGDIDIVMHLPPQSEYVAVHDTTFHLHEHPERAA